MKLSHLQAGETFECPTLETLRNGVVLRSSPSGSFVYIEERNEEKDGWDHVRVSLSNSTTVTPTGKVELVNEGNIINVKKSKAETVISSSDKPETAEKGKKGRKKQVIHFEFPPVEFSVQDLATFNKIEPYQVHNNMAELLATSIEFVREQQGRGRPQKFFKVKTN